MKEDRPRPHHAKQIHRSHLGLHASSSKAQFADVHMYGPTELEVEKLAYSVDWAYLIS